MAQDLPDLGQRVRAGVQHLGRQRVPQPVRAAPLQACRSQARPMTARTASGVSCR